MNGAPFLTQYPRVVVERTADGIVTMSDLMSWTGGTTAATFKPMEGTVPPGVGWDETTGLLVVSEETDTFEVPLLMESQIVDGTLQPWFGSYSITLTVVLEEAPPTEDPSPTPTETPTEDPSPTPSPTDPPTDNGPKPGLPDSGV